MLELEGYTEHEHHLPAKGKFIIAQFNEESIVIYQAFKDSIAEFAEKNQKFGGPDYDFGRMTWLKPSFLWMMYYSGWAKKENQENVLAIRIKREGFDEILKNAVLSSFSKNVFLNEEEWQQQLSGTDVHLQWEHYFDLFGKKTDRFSAKIGIKKDVMEQYNEEWILEIKNITPFVKEQQKWLQTDKKDNLLLPHERAYAPADLTVLKKIDATTISL